MILIATTITILNNLINNNTILILTTSDSLVVMPQFDERCGRKILNSKVRSQTLPPLSPMFPPGSEIFL